jgi:hypothetical protein
VVGTDYPGDCFDRKDYDQETGLYPCRDRSDVKDWRDCPDGPGLSLMMMTMKKLKVNAKNKMITVTLMRIVNLQAWTA